MSTVFMDSGSIITLALNNLLWLLHRAKEEHHIDFVITKAVRKEVIDNPLMTKRYKFEALQVWHLVKTGVIQIVDEDPERTAALMNLANSSFQAKGQFMQLIHYAEMSAIAAMMKLHADTVMIDERTTRYMLERPDKLRYVLSHKLHTRVDMNKNALNQLRKECSDVRFVRSVEFVAVCFEQGMLDEYLPGYKDSRKELLDALLWGLKLNGCAISAKDLETLERLVK